MVEERLRDGRRIAQLIASEVTADATLSAVEADPEAEPTLDGAFAYGVADDGGERVAEVYLHPDRVRVELLANPSAAADAAADAGLRVRPKAVRPPRTLAFVEDGAQAKRVVPVVRAALSADRD